MKSEIVKKIKDEADFTALAYLHQKSVNYLKNLQNNAPFYADKKIINKKFDDSKL